MKMAHTSSFTVLITRSEQKLPWLGEQGTKPRSYFCVNNAVDRLPVQKDAAKTLRLPPGDFHERSQIEL
jgi:hypothetical protein